jgi:hypothetical protein
MARHVFIDNSNVYGVAQRVAESRDVWEHWTSIRIHYKSLFELIEGQDVVTKCLAGSVPPDNDVLWQTARGLGYTTDLLHRVEADDGRLIEQGVDEILHLKIANAILDYKPPQTLVIVSGDGRVSQCGTSFPAQAERALKWKWDVEVWSWSDGLTKQYNRLCPLYAGRVTVNTLDPYYRSITFTKEGTYELPGGGTIKSAGRVVAPLKAARKAA